MPITFTASKDPARRRRRVHRADLLDRRRAVRAARRARRRVPRRRAPQGQRHHRQASDRPTRCRAPNGATIIGVGVGQQRRSDGRRRARRVRGRRAGRRGASPESPRSSVRSRPPGLDPKAVGQAIAEGVAARHLQVHASQEGRAKPTRCARSPCSPRQGQGAAGSRPRRDRRPFQCNARDWVNEPAGELNPTDLAEAAKALAEESPTSRPRSGTRRRSRRNASARCAACRSARTSRRA